MSGESSVSSDDIRTGDYVSSYQGQGYVVAVLPTGQYVVSMSRRAKEGRRVSQDEITKVMRKGTSRWLPVAVKPFEERQMDGRREAAMRLATAGLADVVSRLAAEVLVAAPGASGRGLDGSVGGSGVVDGAKGRQTGGKVLERSLENVGRRGILMYWTVEAGSREEAERVVEADARAMSRVLGTTGAVRVSRVEREASGWVVTGTMALKAGQEATWDDVRETLDEEGLT